MKTYLTEGYKIDKICSCGKKHTEVPKEARIWKEEGSLVGFVWECECGSTLFTSSSNLKKAVGEI
jgi:hypothetical protein